MFNRNVPLFRPNASANGTCCVTVMLCVKLGTVTSNVEKNKSAWTAPTLRGHYPRTQTQTLTLLLLLMKIEKLFFIYKKEETCMYKEKIKEGCVFTKVFTVPPRSPPPPPMLASSECDDNTGQSPASKNPSVPSGTCPAGDRPVIRTRSSPRATDSRPNSQLNSPVSREEIAAQAFAASLISVGDQCSDSSPHCP